MKHIIKNSPPAELKSWFDGQLIEGERINCRYDDLPAEVKQRIKQRLLAEQGHLCCYTGIRIDEADSHIEHLKPQTRCQDHEDIDYHNLLAAYPGNGRSCQFGAVVKDNWYDENLLVNPLHGSCEGRFGFDQNGRVRAANAEDEGAKTTIKKLGLDNGSLTEMRKQAIQAALFRRNQPKSKAQLKKIAESYCQRDNENKFRSFCFVIQHAADRLLQKAERKRQRRLANQ